MATDQNTQSTQSTKESGSSGWSVGWVVFAGSIMIIGGIFQAFEGLAALFNGDFFVVGQNYTYNFDTTTWGWVHLILGVVVACAGVAVFAGRTWGKVVGIILAILSAIANFFFIPYYPFWSLLIIGLDVAVIGALAAYNPEKIDFEEDTGGY